MKTQPFSFLLILSVSLIFSCKKDAASSAAALKEQQDDALKGLEESFETLKEGNAEVVDFRILKEALPEKLIGLERKSHNGQKTGIAGMNVSSAEASYGDGDKTLRITIMDTGGFGAVMGGLAAWSQIEIDNESDQGYERTTLIDGKKAIERYNSKTMEGEISVISADRFLVTINGRNVSEDDMRTAVSKIKIKG